MKNNLWWTRRRDRTDRTGGGRRGRRGFQLEILALEDRQMLSMVIDVSSAADSGPGTLRAAVEAANAATTPVEIDFDLTEGENSITLTSGRLELNNSAVPITIDGPGAASLAIDGDHNDRVFQIDPNVTASISGLTIRDGLATATYSNPFPSGGGVLNEGTATLADVTLSGNDGGDHGGGLENTGNVTLTGCTVSGNQAVSGGGLENNFGVMTLTGTTISGDDAEGPTLFNIEGSVSLTHCTISGDPLPQQFADYGIVNRASGDITFVDSTILGFTSGAFESIFGTTTMNGCTFSGNSGPTGALALGGTSTLTNCTISNNSANFSYSNGGGINISGTATITGCTITGNDAGISGGGVAVFSGGTATITGCTISGNSAPTGGGVQINGLATLTDCTISGNSAEAGGGVFNYGTASLVACTVSGNSAPQGGGIDNYSSAYYTSRTTLLDTIVALNTTGSGGAASDIGGTDPGDVTGSHNLIGTGGSGGLTAANHNLLNVANPGLAPLGDYGGPTETMALQPNSPARHAGALAPGVTADQRGFALDGPPDIGAFQSQSGPLVVDVAIDGLGSGPGKLSLRQAVNLADVLTGGATVTFDNSAFAKKSVIALTAGPLELSNTTGAVKILGPGLGRLAISGGGASRIFQVEQGSSASLTGLTITGGFTTGDGGGLLNQGSITLVDVVVVGNSAASGGGLANLGTALIVGSSIDGNAASADGGGILNTGALTELGGDLSGNSAGTDGGGLYNRGTANLVNSTVDDNTAFAGGGIYADPLGQPVVLIGTQVNRNKGGDIFGRVIRL